MDDTLRPSRRHDKRKQSLYFPFEMLEEIIAECRRQDRSMSWMVQHAWRVARPQILQRQGAELPAALEELEHGAPGDGGIGLAQAQAPQP